MQLFSMLLDRVTGEKARRSKPFLSDALRYCRRFDTPGTGEVAWSHVIVSTFPQRGLK